MGKPKVHVWDPVYGLAWCGSVLSSHAACDAAEEEWLERATCADCLAALARNLDADLLALAARADRAKARLLQLTQAAKVSRAIARAPKLPAPEPPSSSLARAESSKATSTGYFSPF